MHTFSACIGILQEQLLGDVASNNQHRAQPLGYFWMPLQSNAHMSCSSSECCVLQASGHRFCLCSCLVAGAEFGRKACDQAPETPLFIIMLCSSTGGPVILAGPLRTLMWCGSLWRSFGHGYGGNGISLGCYNDVGVRCVLRYWLYTCGLLWMEGCFGSS
jgi:hypothetical protein